MSTTRSPHGSRHGGPTFRHGNWLVRVMVNFGTVLMTLIVFSGSVLYLIGLCILTVLTEAVSTIVSSEEQQTANTYALHSTFMSGVMIGPDYFSLQGKPDSHLSDSIKLSFTATQD